MASLYSIQYSEDAGAGALYVGNGVSLDSTAMGLDTRAAIRTAANVSRAL